MRSVVRIGRKRRHRGSCTCSVDAGGLRAGGAHGRVDPAGAGLPLPAASRAVSMRAVERSPVVHAVVVIPCLNEEGSIRRAALSLGFGTTRAQSCATLVIVDNGSSDGTADVVAGIAAGSKPGTVLPVSEPERGFVPARSRGALEAREVARQLGLHETGVLLVQADADTVYGPGYVKALLAASSKAGPGALIEGVSEAPEPPRGSEAYYALERSLDAQVEPAFGDMTCDAVVDDKVAAFRLSDYLAWGGHRREYGRDGEEILAETTRLLIRARLQDGFRVRADDAVAVTSQRRTFEDPALAFATAGYPRGPGWRKALHAGRPWLDMAAFGAQRDSAYLQELSRLRATHLLGMFRMIPGWFSSERGQPDPWMAAVGLYLSAPPRELAARAPGKLLDWALGGSPASLVRRPRPGGLEALP